MPPGPGQLAGEIVAAASRGRRPAARLGFERAHRVAAGVLLPAALLRQEVIQLLDSARRRASHW
jgi:hypothetical protein